MKRYIIVYRVEDKNGIGFGTKISATHYQLRGDLTVWSIVFR